jgi:hypothetical protein
VRGCCYQWGACSFHCCNCSNNRRFVPITCVPVPAAAEAVPETLLYRAVPEAVGDFTAAGGAVVVTTKTVPLSDMSEPVDDKEFEGRNIERTHRSYGTYGKQCDFFPYVRLSR